MNDDKSQLAKGQSHRPPLSFTSPRPLIPVSSSSLGASSSSKPIELGNVAGRFPVHIFDGGLGTSLSLSPYSFHFTSAETPLWSSHFLLTSGLRQKYLLDLHRRFIRAGSQVVGSATYQASFEGFARTPAPTTDSDGSSKVGRHEAAECMREGLKVVKEAFQLESQGDFGLSALSLGPRGATLVPSTEYSGKLPEEMSGAQALSEWHRERLEVFFPSSHSDQCLEHNNRYCNGNNGDVDLIAFETLGRKDEIIAVRKAIAVLNDRGTEGNIQQSLPPFWISCVFPNEGDQGDGLDLRLPDGSSIDEIIEAMLYGLDQTSPSLLPAPSGIGINCTKLFKLPSLILEFESAIAKRCIEPDEVPDQPMGLFHLVLYPDGANDLVYDTVSQTWVPRGLKTQKSQAELETAVPPSSAESGKETSEEDQRLLRQKAWARELTKIIGDMKLREMKRRQSGKGIWRGLLVGGCCLVDWDGIAHLKDELSAMTNGESDRR